MTESRWIAHVRALIADGEGRLLVLEDGGRHRLPAVEIEGTDDELPAIREALAALVGFDTIVVRSVTRSVDEKRKILDVALELEPRGASAPAAGAVWRTGSQLAASALPAGDRSLVDRLESDRPPPERPQWARRGWFAEASAWIETVLAEHGRRTVEPVEQVSNWCISSVLRVATEEGRVYFKATAPSPLFVDEGTVTHGLAALFPDRIPHPLAVDAGGCCWTTSVRPWGGRRTSRRGSRCCRRTRACS